MSHTAVLDASPLLSGSMVYAGLTLVGLLCVFMSYGRGMIEKKDVSMVMIFVLTAGFSMWIVWFSCWMVSFETRCFISETHFTLSRCYFQA